MGRALRSLFLGAALALPPAAATAGPWHVGARAGLSLTNLHGDLPDLAGPDYQTGFQGGGFVAFAPGPVGLQIEATLVQKGAVFHTDHTDNQGNILGTSEDHLRMTYLEIPVLARAALPLAGAVEPFAVIGPTFGIALGAKYQSGLPGLADIDMGDDLESLDMGGTVGVGARFGHGPYRALAEARYATGFNDLWDISNNLASIHHGFGITVGVEH